jgi:hypothetical protein
VAFLVTASAKAARIDFLVRGSAQTGWVDEHVMPPFVALTILAVLMNSG